MSAVVRFRDAAIKAVAIGGIATLVNSADSLLAANCNPLPAGAIGWWPADVYPVDVVSTNHGILIGGCEPSGAGVVGKCFVFDGTNASVQVPDAPVFHPANFTIECWVRFAKLDSAGSGGSRAGDQYIVFKQNSRGTGFEGFDLSKTRPGADVFRFMVTSAAGQSVLLLSTTTISAGAWYHVAAVRGSNYVNLYVNGQLEAQATVSFPQDYGNLPLCFGSSGQSTWDHKLSGSLDEVTLYKRALTGAEIAAIYQADSAGKCLRPVLLSQPQDEVSAVNSNVVFSVSVLGTPPFSWRWQCENTNLQDSASVLGAATAQLTLLNVQPAAAAHYRVVTTNIAGAVTSSAAFLNVDTHPTPPAMVQQPQSCAGLWGSTVTLNASATGSAPLCCQWRKNGVPLSDATNSSLTLEKLQFSDAGAYELVVTNSYGMANSYSAVLEVRVAELNIAPASGGGPPSACLNIGGVPGRVYSVEVCSNLTPPVVWTAITNLPVYQTNYSWREPGPPRPRAYFRLAPGPAPIGNSPWETMPIGPVIVDNFDRGNLGTNWVVLGDTSVAINSNELVFNHTNASYSRQVFFQPWLTSSDAWTLRWTERFGALDGVSRGVGVGLKNFQTYGGNDRGYNALVCGAGPDFGKVQLERFDGSSQGLLASGPPMSIAPGDLLECYLKRSGWTFTAVATNRANGQRSSASFTASGGPSVNAPTISRICFYPLGGAVAVDNLSFTIDHQKPARFVVVGASTCEGYNASAHEKGFVNVVQSNFVQAVCNDSSSYNTTADGLSVLPEIVAHQPRTAILMIGGNDLAFGVPLAQVQQQYASIVSQLTAQGTRVMHAPVPRSSTDIRGLRNWITNTYAATNIIDTWNPLLSGTYQLNPAYDSGDGLHPNDAGHLLIGTIIRNNLP